MFLLVAKMKIGLLQPMIHFTTGAWLREKKSTLKKFELKTFKMSSCFGFKSCMFVHACMTMFLFEDIYVASQLHSDLCWGC